VVNDTNDGCIDGSVRVSDGCHGRKAFLNDQDVIAYPGVNRIQRDDTIAGWGASQRQGLNHEDLLAVMGGLFLRGGEVSDNARKNHGSTVLFDVETIHDADDRRFGGDFLGEKCERCLTSAADVDRFSRSSAYGVHSHSNGSARKTLDQEQLLAGQRLVFDAAYDISNHLCDEHIVSLAHQPPSGET
jgi:hypothetical protein